jgi:hypothetical protein
VLIVTFESSRNAASTYDFIILNLIKHTHAI